MSSNDLAALKSALMKMSEGGIAGGPRAEGSQMLRDYSLGERRPADLWEGNSMWTDAVTDDLGMQRERGRHGPLNRGGALSGSSIEWFNNGDTARRIHGGSHTEQHPTHEDYRTNDHDHGRALYGREDDTGPMGAGRRRNFMPGYRG